jgi:hypothetical protein
LAVAAENSNCRVVICVTRKYGDPGCRTIGDWWTTLLNAYGNPVRYFGNEDLVLKQNGCSHAGPLEELLV